MSYWPRWKPCKNPECEVKFLATGPNSRWCPECADGQRRLNRIVRKRLARIRQKANPEFTAAMMTENLATIAYLAIKQCKGSSYERCVTCIVSYWCPKYKDNF